jgi:hypothetical protein
MGRNRSTRVRLPAGKARVRGCATNGATASAAATHPARRASSSLLCAPSSSGDTVKKQGALPPASPWIVSDASTVAVASYWWYHKNTDSMNNIFMLKMSLLASGHASGIVIPAILDWSFANSTCAQKRGRDPTLAASASTASAWIPQQAAPTATSAGVATATVATHTSETGAGARDAVFQSVSSTSFTFVALSNSQLGQFKKFSTR